MVEMLGISLEVSNWRSILLNLQTGKFPAFIESDFPQFLSLLTDMLSLDPSLRPSIKDILGYAIFSHSLQKAHRTSQENLKYYFLSGYCK